MATFALMIAIPSVSWGSLDLPGRRPPLAVGWPVYVLGIVEYYVAAGVYAVDLRRALQTA